MADTHSSRSLLIFKGAMAVYFYAVVGFALMLAIGWASYALRKTFAPTAGKCSIMDTLLVEDPESINPVRGEFIKISTRYGQGYIQLNAPESSVPAPLFGTAPWVRKYNALLAKVLPEVKPLYEKLQAWNVAAGKYNDFFEGKKVTELPENSKKAMGTFIKARQQLGEQISKKQEPLTNYLKVLNLAVGQYREGFVYRYLFHGLSIGGIVAAVVAGLYVYARLRYPRWGFVAMRILWCLGAALGVEVLMTIILRALHPAIAQWVPEILHGVLLTYWPLLLLPWMTGAYYLVMEFRTRFPKLTTGFFLKDELPSRFDETEE